MPLYEYYCPRCGFEYEKRKAMDEYKEDICECGFKSQLVPSVNIFELKGGGWYNSGYTKGE